MNTPNKCSVVLAAGSALEDIWGVYVAAHYLAMKTMEKPPYAMILLVDNPDIDLTVKRWHETPAVVRVDIH